MFELDLDYVQRVSLSLDFRILLSNLRTVLVREGVSMEGEATTTEFTGGPE